MIHVDGGYHAVGAPPVETVEAPEGVLAAPTSKEG
jgi:meromycolic acid enoyl-[acyl-carrier-protein] reductase